MAEDAKIHRDLKLTKPLTKGDDVKVLQQHLNTYRAANSNVAEFDKLDEDGRLGAHSFNAAHRVAYLLGLPHSRLEEIGNDTIAERVQTLVRHPNQRSDDEKKEAEKRHAKAAHKDDHHDGPVPPVVDGGWHPGAVRVPYSSPGSFTGGGHKLVWHTTEGSGLPHYSGSAPHFTLDPVSGKLYQHVPISLMSASLEHPSGTLATNSANAIQVELMGFAAKTASWPDSAYAHLAALARWIEAHAGVPRRCSVTFSNTPHRMGEAEFVSYAGHCGHEHVPSQPSGHWDPGSLAIAKVLK